MRSLVIGGAGFAGRYLAQHLFSQGHEVTVTRMPLQKADIAGASVYELNILDQMAVLEVLKRTEPDFVFHLAAQSSVAVSWKDPQMTVDVNIKGSTNVLDGLSRMKKKPRVLLVGSSEEYGKVLPKEMPVCETAPVRPVNIYAATKACQNMMGRIFAQAYGMDIVMVRAFNHIGPGQAPIYVVSDFCRQVAMIEAGKKEAVIRVGNLSARRDFTDVRDVVRAYTLLVERGQVGETYNVGCGHAACIRDILQIILDQSHVRIRVEEDKKKMRPVDVPVIEADIHKLQEAVGWKPQISLEQTIEEMLDYWRMSKEQGVNERC